MPTHDIIVVGASAGGVEAITQLVKKLPPDFPASIFIVLHIPSESDSMLAKILNRKGSLPASTANDRETIEPGRIYVARPDCHLLIKRGHVRLVRGPRENNVRPAIDPLFRTAARSYGPRVVGVVLSGTLDDGTAGLLSIKSRGGTAIVQDPEEALYTGMPKSALENVAVDYCLPAAGIAETLIRLASEPVEEEVEKAMSDELEEEADIAEFDLNALKRDDRPGIPSHFTCPECHGVLFELDEQGLLRFRCRVGHAYSSETLLQEQATALEDALWVALRSLEENIALARRLARRMRDRGNERSARQFDERAEELESRIAVIRRVMLDPEVAAKPQINESGDSSTGGEVSQK